MFLCTNGTDEANVRTMVVLNRAQTLRKENNQYGNQQLTPYIKFIGLILMGLLAVTGSSLAADDQWERKENMPESSRCCAAAATVDGKVYFIGGIEVNRAPHIPNPGDMTLDRVQAYDPATDTWTAKRSMPTKRARMAAVTFDGMIYVFGGAERRSGKVLDA